MVHGLVAGIWRMLQRLLPQRCLSLRLLLVFRVWGFSFARFRSLSHTQTHRVRGVDPTSCTPFGVTGWGLPGPTPYNLSLSLSLSLSRSLARSFSHTHSLSLSFTLSCLGRAVLSLPYPPACRFLLNPHHPGPLLLKPRHLLLRVSTPLPQCLRKRVGVNRLRVSWYRERRRCSRDTNLKSYITKCNSIRILEFPSSSLFSETVFSPPESPKPVSSRLHAPWSSNLSTRVRTPERVWSSVLQACQDILKLTWVPCS